MLIFSQIWEAMATFYAFAIFGLIANSMLFIRSLAHAHLKKKQIRIELRDGSTSDSLVTRIDDNQPLKESNEVVEKEVAGAREVEIENVESGSWKLGDSDLEEG